MPLLALNATNVVIPATNPGVIDANMRNAAFPLQDYIQPFTRILSPLDGDGLSRRQRQQTFRVASSLNGDVGTSGFIWDVGATFSQNDQWTQDVDTIADRWSRAVQGYGGPGCKWNLVEGVDSNPDLQPGLGACQYWNPFASRLIAEEGDATYNDPALLEWMLYGDTQVGMSRFYAVEAVTTGELFELPGGPTGIAVGAQFRRQDVDVEVDPIRKDGGFGFNTQSFSDWDASRESKALFGELAFYPIENLELDVAARWEETLGQESVEPKVSALWRPLDGLFLRGTWGTSFRLPSEFQLFGNGGAGPPRDEIGGQTIQANALVVGNPDLKPEESENYTLGFTWDVTDWLTLESTYWNYEFTNLVTQEDFETLFRDDWQDGFISDDPRWPLFPGRPNEVCEITGRWDSTSGDPLPAGCVSGFDIAIFQGTFINAQAIETDGFDLGATLRREMLGGEAGIQFIGTYVNAYSGQDPVTGELVDAVGTDAFGVNGVGYNAQIRANTAFTYDRGNHSARLTWRHTSEVDITDPNVLVAPPASEEKAFDTFDLNYTYMFDMENPLRLTLGVINATNELPPVVGNSLSTTNTGTYDSRGRLFNISVNYAFN